MGERPIRDVVFPAGRQAAYEKSCYSPVIRFVTVACPLEAEHG